MKLKYDIIVPVHDGVSQETLVRTFNSIQLLEYRNFKVYVGIDGCIARSKIDSITKSLLGLKYQIVHLPKTGRPGYVRNRLIELGDGDIIVMNDSDDLSMKNRLDIYNDYFINEDLYLISGSMRVINNNYQTIGYRHHKLQMLNLSNRALLICPFNNPAVAFRRRSYGSRFFDESANKSEDYRLWIDIISEGLSCLCIDDILVEYMQSDDDLSKRRGLKYVLSDWNVKIVAVKKLGNVKNIHLIVLSTLIPILRLLPLKIFNSVYKRLNVKSKPQ